MTLPPQKTLSTSKPGPESKSSVDFGAHVADARFPKRGVRIMVSLLVLWHLAGVIGRPWEFATQGPYGNSPSASTFYQVVDGYSQFMYLDHGYAFFAPDPGPSHYFVAELRKGDGQQEELKFPDLSQQRPRLLYHRHFMLAEFLNNVFHPVDEPPADMGGDPIARTGWLRERQRYLDVKQSMVDHLSQEHSDAQVVIRRGEHRQPGLPEFIGEQMDIRDPRLMMLLLDRDESSSIANPPQTGITPPLQPVGGTPSIQGPLAPEVIGNPGGEVAR